MKNKITIDVTERPNTYTTVTENKINNTIIEKPSAVRFIEKIMKRVRS